MKLQPAIQQLTFLPTL